jgi:hypothetical protein
MPHYYRNWGRKDFRRFTINGILWSAGLEVPTEGANTPPPKLESFAPAAIDPVPPKPAKRASKKAP